MMQVLEEMGACPEAKEWLIKSPHETLKSAWLACERGDWLLWFAQRRGVDIRTLTLAKCACARLALPHTMDPRILATIMTAERWARGMATDEELMLARGDALDAAHSLSNDSSTVAAKCAAFAAAAAATTKSTTYFASRSATTSTTTYFASCSATLASEAAAGAAASTLAMAPVLRKCADIVREFFPTLP